MIERILQPRLLDLATRYPVLTLTGPRQSGKTTLSRMATLTELLPLSLAEIRRFPAPPSRRSAATAGSSPGGTSTATTGRRPEPEGDSFASGEPSRHRDRAPSQPAVNGARRAGKAQWRTR